MGASCSVSVGVYIEVSKQSCEYVEQVNTCGNTSCQEHGRRSDGKFCPTCGTAITECGITRQGELGWYDFLELCQCDYYQHILHAPEYAGNKNYDIYLRNLHEDAHFGIKCDPDGDNIADLSDVNMSEVISQFEEKYADLLTEMRNFFKEVNVKYGIVSYWS